MRSDTRAKWILVSLAATGTLLALQWKHAGRSRPPEPALLESSCPASRCWFAPSVRAIDDLSGDGIPDLVVRTDSHDGSGALQRTVVALHRGTGAGPERDPFWMFEIAGSMGSAVAADLDGDLRRDLVVGARDDRIRIFAGGSGGLASAPTWEIHGPSQRNGSTFGEGIARAGDLDGDGDEDLVVAATHADWQFEDEGAIFVVRGSDSGPTLDSWSVWGGARVAYLGQSLFVADLNGDGHAEILSSVRLLGTGAEIRVYPGTSEDFSKIPQVLRAPTLSAEFAAAAVGDLDNDGRLEVVAFGNDLLDPFLSLHQVDNGLLLPATLQKTWTGRHGGIVFGRALPGPARAFALGVEDVGGREIVRLLVVDSSGFRTASTIAEGGADEKLAAWFVGDLDSDGCEDIAVSRTLKAQRPGRSRLGEWLGIPPATPAYPGFLGGTTRILPSRCVRAP